MNDFEYYVKLHHLLDDLLCNEPVGLSHKEIRDLYDETRRRAAALGRDKHPVDRHRNP
jgi:hypothetical protein